MDSFIYRESFNNSAYVKTFFNEVVFQSKKAKGPTEKFFTEKMKDLQRLVEMNLNKKNFQLSEMSSDCLKLLPKKISEVDKKQLTSEIKQIIAIAHASSLKIAKTSEKVKIEDIEDPTKPLLKRKNVFKDNVNKFITDAMNKEDAGSLIKNLLSLGAHESDAEKGHRKFTLHSKFTVVPYHGKSGEIGYTLRRCIIDQILGENWSEIYFSEENRDELK
jgi:hypothetical protein